MPGRPDPLGATRAALRDALSQLGDAAEAVILVGAHAIYLHAGRAETPLAPATKDADLTIDVRRLGDEPLLERAMEDAGFHRDDVSGQPGAWIGPSGVPVDLMVAPSQSGADGRRGARIPPHSSTAARRTAGMEGVLADNVVLPIDCPDGTTFEMRVAGPAALLVSKLHKIAERRAIGRTLEDKDAHDVYRLLQAIPTSDLAFRWKTLLRDERARHEARAALGHLRELFASGPTAPGAMMAGRAEAVVGDPDRVAASVAVLADDLLVAVADEEPHR